MPAPSITTSGSSRGWCSAWLRAPRRSSPSPRSADPLLVRTAVLRETPGGPSPDPKAGGERRCLRPRTGFGAGTAPLPLAIEQTPALPVSGPTWRAHLKARRSHSIARRVIGKGPSVRLSLSRGEDRARWRGAVARSAHHEGLLKNPVATAEAIRDGWLTPATRAADATGSSDTGRKKELRFSPTARRWCRLRPRAASR